MLLIADATATTVVQDPTSVTFWLQTFGPTGLILFLLGSAGWKVWTFFKPIILKTSDAHVVLVEKLGQAQEAQSATLISIQKQQEVHGEKILEIHKRVHQWECPAVKTQGSH